MLIAIEGIDGSGKGTQAKRLLDRLLAAHVSATLVSFPRYSQTHFGRTIGRFLNGEFGALDVVDPHLAATLYASDRLESKSFLIEQTQKFEVVVCDRYVASNTAHQGAKRSGTARRALQDWIATMEYGVFALPRADLTILLDLSAESAQTLIAKKAQRDYTDKKVDIQEADVGYLRAVRDVYLDVAGTEANWERVPVEVAGEIRSIDAVSDDIWRIVNARRGG